MQKEYHYVLDCSVTMAWCFEDEVCDYTETALDLLDDKGAIAPAIWPLEVTNVLLMASKRKRLPPAKAAAFIDRLSDLPIYVANSKALSSVSSILNLGHELDITSYDASYLELAMTKNLPLATLDKKLIAAAKKAGIALL